jgi:hypothetical protein
MRDRINVQLKADGDDNRHLDESKEEETQLQQIARIV